MKATNAKNYTRDINKMRKFSEGYSEDLLLVTSLKKPTVNLLTDILSVHMVTETFFKKMYEKEFFNVTADKWTRNKLESKAMLDGYIDQEEIAVIKEEVEKEFATSITNKKYISKFLKINYTGKLKNRIMIQDSQEGDVEDEDDHSYANSNNRRISFNQSFINNFNEKVKQNEPKSYIDLIIKNNKLNKKLTKNIFKELLNILNKKKELSDKENKIAMFLQNLLTYYLPNVLTMSNVVGNCNICTLRKMPEYSTVKYNSLCLNCYKRLKRKSSKPYCSNRDSNSCYKEKTKKGSYSLPQEICIIKCCNCSKTIKKFIIHKIDLIPFKFCSERCYETYRKRIKRSK